MKLVFLSVVLVHTMFIVPFFFHFLLHFLHILFSVAKIERNIHTVRTKTTDRNTNFIDRLINLSFQHPISVKKSNFVSTRRIALSEIMKIDTVRQYNDYFGVETLHLSVSVIEGCKAKPLRYCRKLYNLYAILL